MTLKQLLASYRGVHYWWHGLYSAAWREMNALPDEHRERRREIETLLHKVKDLLEASFGPEIGKQTMSEIRTKDM